MTKMTKQDKMIRELHRLAETIRELHRVADALEKIEKNMETKKVIHHYYETPSIPYPIPVQTPGTDWPKRWDGAPIVTCNSELKGETK